MADNNVKSRLHWIDISKGILILLVVFHHLPQVVLSKGQECVFWQAYDDLKSYYACFFMASFFILSGYVSNFDKRFPRFIWDSFKGIIIPVLSINTIKIIITSIYSGTSVCNSCLTIIKLFALLGGRLVLLGAIYITHNILVY